MRRLLRANNGGSLTLPVYATTAVDYDGTNDYQTKGSDLTGNADGKQGTFSAWLRFDGGDGSEQRFLANTSRFFIRKGTGNRLQVFGEASLLNTAISIISDTTYTASSTWRHFLASWNLATGVGQLYVNDVSDLQAGATLDNEDIDYTQTAWAIGASTGGGVKFNGCMSELFFHTAYIDLSIVSNRRKFISANMKPVFLGADGSRPLGVQPIIYAPNGDASTNLGSGGAFVTTGELTACSSSPSAL